ncbi:heavy-metal-associated domain-containing protein [Tenacibaculum jejuense]|uniref:Heavy metal transport/detoxification protein n=1 Tax=Tenacibaculum jejuense TaxID=584609 RepID=A0A238UDG4_9FLAO|nr:cation transporter [Tenacibaculum jejuense]SNR17219.1 Heavy metal transport/detoxification protein [Tenacibaculum jejuense]
MKKIITLLCLIFITVSSFGQQKKKRNAKLAFKVDGVCMECKVRIEKAALNTKGVKYANWNLETHQLMVIIDERKTDKKIVCQNVAKVGHDTKEIKATQEDYEKLDACCRYRDEEVVKNHKKN